MRSLSSWLRLLRKRLTLLLRLLGTLPAQLLLLRVQRSRAGAQLQRLRLFVGFADDLLITVFGGPIVKAHAELLEELALTGHLHPLVG